MAKKTFDDFVLRSTNAPVRQCLVDSGDPRFPFGWSQDPRRGWALLCGYDERNYAVIIQKAADDREIMVRAGCKWKSLKQARSHWVSAARNRSISDRRTAKQILALVGIGVARARAYGWTNQTFNSNPRKVAR